MKVKTILVSHPEQSENSPYHQIIEKYKVKIWKTGRTGRRIYIYIYEKILKKGNLFQTGWNKNSIFYKNDYKK